MKYKQVRPDLSPELIKTVSREIRRQGVGYDKLTKKNLKELAAICKTIEKSGLPENLVCKKLPGDLGYGIFLHPKAQPIVKGQVIGSYSGKILIAQQSIPDDSAYAFEALEDMLLTKEEQALYDKKSAFHPRRKYTLNFDAESAGNFTRFINHSDKPNLIAETLQVPKNSFGLTPSPIEVVYFANKTIRPGEQLLVSYEGEEDSYWGVFNIKPIQITPKTLRLVEKKIGNTSVLELQGSI